jgi:hypothetical protein
MNQLFNEMLVKGRIEDKLSIENLPDLSNGVTVSPSKTI